MTHRLTFLLEGERRCEVRLPEAVGNRGVGQGYDRSLLDNVPAIEPGSSPGYLDR